MDTSHAPIRRANRSTPDVPTPQGGTVEPANRARVAVGTFQTPEETSAERYERDGWLLRPMRNLGCLALYFDGLPPTVIRRLYG